MKRKAFKRQRNRAFALFRQWQRSMGLGYWEIEYRWHDDGSSTFARDDGNVTLARTHVQWMYCYATIDINTPALADISDDKLEYMVVHELCHVLVNEMRGADWQREHEERVVTMLAKGFLWVRDIEQEKHDGA